MKISTTPIQDLLICEPNKFEDSRGYFMESFRLDKLEMTLGKELNFIQDNESKSSHGVIRGLHYQQGDFAQSKLVRVVYGEVLDVVVDLRLESPTFGQHFKVLLNTVNNKQVFVPKGFAHGFAVLSAKAIFQYKVDAPYSREHERGIQFNDDDLNIDWMIPENQRILSEKDLDLPKFKDAEYFAGNSTFYKDIKRVA